MYEGVDGQRRASIFLPGSQTQTLPPPSSAGRPPSCKRSHGRCYITPSRTPPYPPPPPTQWREKSPQSVRTQVKQLVRRPLGHVSGSASSRLLCHHRKCLWTETAADHSFLSPGYFLNYSSTRLRPSQKKKKKRKRVRNQTLITCCAEPEVTSSGRKLKEKETILTFKTRETFFFFSFFFF